MRICTLNVVKEAHKEKNLFLSFDYVSFDVMFMQECHLKDKENVGVFLKAICVGCRKCVVHGGGILFKGWDIKINTRVSIVPGRVLCVDCRWKGVPLRLILYKLINVYAPTYTGGGGGGAGLRLWGMYASSTGWYFWVETSMFLWIG